MPLRLLAALVSRPKLPSDEGINRQYAFLDHFEEAMKIAWPVFEKNARSDVPTQYVCLAQENFFSGTVSRAFIAHDLKQWVVSTLAKLSRQYPKVLLVPGTVRWTRSLVKPGEEEEKYGLRKQKALQAIVSDKKNHPRGGYSSGATQSGMFGYKDGVPKFEDDVQKVKDKNPMLARNTVYVCLGGFVLKYHKKCTYEGEVNYCSGNIVFEPGTVEGVFTVGGVRYGIEVCKDHGTALQQDVDVHLLVSDWTHFRESRGKVLLHASTDKDQKQAIPKSGWASVETLADPGPSVKLYAIDLPAVAASDQYAFGWAKTDIPAAKLHPFLTEDLKYQRPTVV